jgi:hypothetical protein
MKRENSLHLWWDSYQSQNPQTFIVLPYLPFNSYLTSLSLLFDKKKKRMNQLGVSLIFN